MTKDERDPAVDDSRGPLITILPAKQVQALFDAHAFDGQEWELLVERLQFWQVWLWRIEIALILGGLAGFWYGAVGGGRPGIWPLVSAFGALIATVLVQNVIDARVVGLYRDFAYAMRAQADLCKAMARTEQQSERDQRQEAEKQ